jgi:hypothetical protein|tara:strand:+ start:402 stop:578 length:177 start_codon:yes stop_codon:yes gene_type:complete
MPKRTYENSAYEVSQATDIEKLVNDKREQWRASTSKANQRQRRYKKRITKQLLLINRK